MVHHLLAVPSPTDAEQEAPAREHVDRRHGFGGLDGIPLHDQADPRSELERTGRFRGECERDERIQQSVVLLRQLVTAWPRTLAAGGDVRVLREPQGFEATLLHRPRQLARTHRMLGEEHRLPPSACEDPPSSQTRVRLDRASRATPVPSGASPMGSQSEGRTPACPGDGAAPADQASCTRRPARHVART